MSQVGGGSVAAVSRQFLFLVKSETSSQTSCFLANGPPPPQKITSHIADLFTILSLLFLHMCLFVSPVPPASS